MPYWCHWKAWIFLPWDTSQTVLHLCCCVSCCVVLCCRRCCLDARSEGMLLLGLRQESPPMVTQPWCLLSPDCPCVLEKSGLLNTARIYLCLAALMFASTPTITLRPDHGWGHMVHTMVSVWEDICVCTDTMWSSSGDLWISWRTQGTCCTSGYVCKSRENGCCKTGLMETHRLSVVVLSFSL